MNTQDQPQPRTQGEAIIDVMYGIIYNDMNARLYGRIDGFITLINLLGGSAIFVTMLNDKNSMISGMVGLFIALMALIQQIVKPAEKKIACNIHKEKYGQLASRAASLNLQEIDVELRILQTTGPDTISSLAIPAYNQNVISNGFPSYKLKETTWNKIVKLLI